MIRRKKHKIISYESGISALLVFVFVFSPIFLMPNKKAEAQYLGGVAGYTTGLAPTIAALPQCKEFFGRQMKGLFRGIGSLFSNKSNDTSRNTSSDVEGLTDEEFYNLYGKERIKVDMAGNILNEKASEAKNQVDSIKVTEAQVVAELKKQGKAINQTAVATEFLNANSSCYQSIGRLIIKMLLQKLTVSTVAWINTGFDGSPSFIQSPDKFLKDIAETEILQFGIELNDPDLYPFSKDWLRGVALLYNRKVQDVAKYSLDELVKNTTPQYSAMTFKQDFSQGGWNAWDAMTQVPANNSIGFPVWANHELSKRLRGTSQSTAERVQTALEWGDGFLGDEKCVAPNGMTKSQEREDLKAGGKGCTGGWEYVTPGKLIANAADRALGYPNSVLLNGQDLNDAVAAILDALMGQFFPWVMEKGFSALGSDGADGTLFSLRTNDNLYRSQAEKDYAPIHLASSWLKTNPDFNIRTDLTQALIDEQRTYIDKLALQNKEIMSTTDGKEYSAPVSMQMNTDTSCDRAILGALCDNLDFGLGDFDWSKGLYTNMWYRDVTLKDNDGGGGWLPDDNSNGKSGTWNMGVVLLGTWTALEGTGGTGDATWKRNSVTDTSGTWTSSTGKGEWTVSNDFMKDVMLGWVGLSTSGTWIGGTSSEDLIEYNDKKGAWDYGFLYHGEWTANEGTGGTGDAVWKRDSGTASGGTWISSTGKGVWTDTGVLPLDPSILNGKWTENGERIDLKDGEKYDNSSNAYGLLPAIFQLDYCIPGPHPGWEDDSYMVLSKVMDLVQPLTLEDVQNLEGKAVLGAAKNLAPLAGAVAGPVIAGAVFSAVGISTTGAVMGSVVPVFGTIIGAAIGLILGGLLGIGGSNEKTLREYYARQVQSMTGYLPDYEEPDDDRTINITNKGAMMQAMYEILDRYAKIINKIYFSNPEILPSSFREARALFDQVRGYNQIMSANEEKMALMKSTINILNEIKSKVDHLNVIYPDGADGNESTENQLAYDDAIKEQINIFGRLTADMVNGDDIAEVDYLLKDIIATKNYIYTHLLKGPQGCEQDLMKPQQPFPNSTSETSDWQDYNVNSVKRPTYPFPILYEYNFKKGATLPDPWGQGSAYCEKFPANDSCKESYANTMPDNQYSEFGGQNGGFLSFVFFSSNIKAGKMSNGISWDDLVRGPERLHIHDLLPMWAKDKDDNSYYNRALGERSESSCSVKTRYENVCNSGPFEHIIGIY